ncbi:MAG: hypothetical protein WDN04_28235 [Rhodospirillales bacterium]
MTVRRFRPTVSAGFAILEPDLGPTPPNIELFRTRVLESTGLVLGEVERLMGV